MPRSPRLPLCVALAALSACARTPPPVVAPAPLPIPVAAPRPPMPAGTYAGMIVPALLADGEYDTPNRALSSAATVWHFRTGLNFAALACRGAEEGAVIAGYNALLATQKPVLARAEATLAAEYRATGGADWRDAYDDAMTRLYNYWSLGAARPALCATSLRLLGEAASVPQDRFAAFAAARLPELDGAVTQVYRAYDDWRGVQPQPTYAVAASAPVGLARIDSAPERRVPWIEVDPAVLRMP